MTSGGPRRAHCHMQRTSSAQRGLAVHVYGADDRTAGVPGTRPHRLQAQLSFPSRREAGAGIRPYRISGRGRGDKHRTIAPHFPLWKSESTKKIKTKTDLRGAGTSQVGREYNDVATPDFRENRLCRRVLPEKRTGRRGYAQDTGTASARLCGNDIAPPGLPRRPSELREAGHAGARHRSPCYESGETCGCISHVALRRCSLACARLEGLDMRERKRDGDERPSLPVHPTRSRIKPCTVFNDRGIMDESAGGWDPERGAHREIETACV